MALVQEDDGTECKEPITPRVKDVHGTGSRDAQGRFLPGVKQGPGRGPQAMSPELKRFIRERSLEAAEVVAEVMRDKSQPGKTRILGASLLLAYAYGRPQARVEHAGADKGVSIQFILPGAEPRTLPLEELEAEVRELPEPTG